MFSMAVRTAQVDRIREMLEAGTKTTSLDEPVRQLSCAKQRIAAAVCNYDVPVGINVYYAITNTPFSAMQIFNTFELAQTTVKHDSHLWALHSCIPVVCCTKLSLRSACLSKGICCVQGALLLSFAACKAQEAQDALHHATKYYGTCAGAEVRPYPLLWSIRPSFNQSVSATCTDYQHPDAHRVS